MTCCEKCEAPIRNGFGEKVGEQCINPNCPCHSKDEELERVLGDFDKKFSSDWFMGFTTQEDLNKLGIGGIKSFITQVYKEAYKAGQEGKYLPLEESMAYKKGREEERERIRKELPKLKPIRKYYPNGGGVMEEHIEWNDCLDQVKKII